MSFDSYMKVYGGADSHYDAPTAEGFVQNAMNEHTVPTLSAEKLNELMAREYGKELKKDDRFVPFSPEEQTRRAELSQKARRAIFTRVADRRFAKCPETGVDYADDLMMDFTPAGGPANAAVREAFAAPAAHGKELIDLHYRMLTEFEASRPQKLVAAGMTDEELVENYDSLHRASKLCSSFGEIRTYMQENGVVPTDEESRKKWEECQRIMDRYEPLADFFREKELRADNIASPYYQVIDPDAPQTVKLAGRVREKGGRFLTAEEPGDAFTRSYDITDYLSDRAERTELTNGISARLISHAFGTEGISMKVTKDGKSSTVPYDPAALTLQLNSPDAEVEVFDTAVPKKSVSVSAGSAPKYMSSVLSVTPSEAAWNTEPPAEVQKPKAPGFFATLLHAVNKGLYADTFDRWEAEDKKYQKYLKEKEEYENRLFMQQTYLFGEDEPEPAPEEPPKEAPQDAPEEEEPENEPVQQTPEEMKSKEPARSALGVEYDPKNNTFVTFVKTGMTAADEAVERMRIASGGELPPDDSVAFLHQLGETEGGLRLLNRLNASSQSLSDQRFDELRQDRLAPGFRPTMGEGAMTEYDPAADRFVRIDSEKMTPAQIFAERMRIRLGEDALDRDMVYAINFVSTLPAGNDALKGLNGFGQKSAAIGYERLTGSKMPEAEAPAVSPVLVPKKEEAPEQKAPENPKVLEIPKAPESPVNPETVPNITGTGSCVEYDVRGDRFVHFDDSRMTPADEYVRRMTEAAHGRVPSDGAVAAIHKLGETEAGKKLLSSLNAAAQKRAEQRLDDKLNGRVTSESTEKYLPTLKGNGDKLEYDLTTGEYHLLDSEKLGPAELFAERMRIRLGVKELDSDIVKEINDLSTSPEGVKALQDLNDEGTKLSTEVFERETGLELKKDRTEEKQGPAHGIPDAETMLERIREATGLDQLDPQLEANIRALHDNAVAGRENIALKCASGERFKGGDDVRSVVAYSVISQRIMEGNLDMNGVQALAAPDAVRDAMSVCDISKHVVYMADHPHSADFYEKNLLSTEGLAKLTDRTGVSISEALEKHMTADKAAENARELAARRAEEVAARRAAKKPNEPEPEKKKPALPTA